MLPWYKGRPPQQSETGGSLVMGPVEEESSEGMGLRAMAMKAIAQDLISAIETKDVEKAAYVLECLAECIGDMG